MERYTVEQRVFIVKTYYQNSESFSATLRKYRTKFGQRNAPNINTIRNTIQKFEATGSIVDVKTPTRVRTERSAENIASVSRSVEESPRTSIRHRSQQLHISTSTLQRILTKDLHLRAYKIQLVQELKPTDHSKRRAFVNWMLEKKEENDEFFSEIILSDEAHFHLGGFVNKQNCRIWGDENPRMIEQRPLYPEKVTVWCGFWARGVIGPYFFENAAGKSVTVNAERYRNMINEFLVPELDNIDLENIWFQQDGATCHTATETIDLLKTKFPGRVISRFGDINWPPRSCDLTPLDFFLWGFVKEKVYANNPTTIPELKNNIQQVIREIEPTLCAKVMENFGKRMVACQRSRGGHLSDIVFHY